ncbi:Rieske (2Fe-2S) protein [Nonomuraea purpurea]|uniref:Cytochrome bc1 complex Rieske iron-sulfur subunit n=1 Tax=Nonomuraea purpurea TaxID=1849276 RepID=A0ABV8G8F4_9ACTN
MGDDLRSRRTVFAGVGAGGLALAISACGGGSDTAQTSGGTESGTPAGGMLAKTADIPVGGGTIFKDQKIVVTQPTSGQFKAFSAVCTHNGCTVGSVENGVIVCPCHNSKFGIADGAVTDGPADKPLPAQKIKVDGDQITLA